MAKRGRRCDQRGEVPKNLPPALAQCRLLMKPLHLDCKNPFHMWGCIWAFAATPTLLQKGGKRNASLGLKSPNISGAAATPWALQRLGPGGTGPNGSLGGPCHLGRISRTPSSGRDVGPLCLGKDRRRSRAMPRGPVVVTSASLVVTRRIGALVPSSFLLLLAWHLFLPRGPGTSKPKGSGSLPT